MPMPQAQEMTCPECGVEMNHHATKVNYSVNEDEIDPAFGGVLEEAHSCPKCGRTEIRRVNS